MNNTSLLYPLSGETIIHGGTGTTNYTTTDTGIVYLAGMFTANTDTITVSINAKSLIFSAPMYATNSVTITEDVVASTVTTVQNQGYIEYSTPGFKSKFVNLLQPTSDFYPHSFGLMGYGGTTASLQSTLIDPKLDACCPTDRNRGPYLPVKKGDVFAFSGAGEVIASYLYF